MAAGCALAIARRRHLSGRWPTGWLKPATPPCCWRWCATQAHRFRRSLRDALRFARDLPALQAPLATRADLPLAYAFELFWPPRPTCAAPADPVSGRFPGDRPHRPEHREGGPGPPRPARTPTRSNRSSISSPAVRWCSPSRPRGLLGVDRQTAERILIDRDGEALVAALKVLGMNGRRPSRPSTSCASRERTAAGRQRHAGVVLCLRFTFFEQGSRACDLLGLGDSSSNDVSITGPASYCLIFLLLEVFHSISSATMLRVNSSSSKKTLDYCVRGVHTDHMFSLPVRVPVHFVESCFRRRRHGWLTDQGRNRIFMWLCHADDFVPITLQLRTSMENKTELVDLTADIVAAYVGNNAVPATDLPNLDQ